LITTLKNIATIQTGLFAKPVDKGELVYLQSRHFDENGHLLSTLYPDLMGDGILEKHILRVDDVLFASKGTKIFAFVFKINSQLAVASTSFFVLRLTDKNVLPEYLAWLLNSQSIQEFLKRHALGTSITSISKKVLEGLEIPVPALETQKKILGIAKLRDKEKSLKLEIESLREKQIQNQILKSIKI